MKIQKSILVGLFVISTLSVNAQKNANYKIVDTAQSKCFDDKEVIKAPKSKDAFYGQDAQHIGNKPSYTDNGDGTITDNVTGLIWQKGYEVMSYNDALKKIEKFKLAGHKDWRIPTIKEAYSLILFSGSDVNPQIKTSNGMPGVPFMDINYFDFKYGANGQRPIDSQMLSSTLYVGSSGRDQLLFGVNFADGRIKGYGLGLGGQEKQFLVRFVRGNTYGENKFKDNKNGTISDTATSLMWSKSDSKKAMNWEDALAYAQKMNSENYLGHSDWRVPNAKELQSIVDYSRSPLTTSSAAIDPMFNVSTITDESGATDYPFYWSSTTHENSGDSAGSAAVYVAFGRSLGNMSNAQGMGMGAPGGMQGGERPQMRGGERPPMGDRPEGDRPNEGDMKREGSQNRKGQSGSKEPNWVDIHGAGCQRSDPKSDDPTPYKDGKGPQGDAVRIYNYVRLVRDL